MSKLYPIAATAPRYIGLISIGVLWLGLATGNARGQNLLIDDFSTDQSLIFAIGAGSTTSSAATTVGSDILGGERDVELRVVAGAVVSGEITGGNLNFSVAAATTGEGFLAWDGPDGLPDSADLDPTGLGGVDLTVGGTLDSMLVGVASSDQPGTMIVTIYTDGGNFSTFTQAIPVTGSAIDFYLPLSAFVVGGGSGADFTNVGAITLFVTGTEIDARFDELVMVSLIQASKTDALLIDNDFDGLLGPGDTLRYTVQIVNADDGGDASATGVQFSSSVDANASLVAGSVTTSQGTVTTGNTAGDTTVAVDVGTITDAATVTITFDIVVANPVPNGVVQISCQGTVDSDTLSLPTDDPDDPTSSSDPTPSPVVSPSVTASKTDGLLVDNAPASEANPGDTLRYTITLTNTGTAAASGVTYTNPAVVNTSLVAGSVTSTQGTVTTGNTAGDMTVAVDVGILPLMGSVTITFDVLISPLPAGVTELTCQGTVTGTNFSSLPTDDPDVGGMTDPTTTPVTAAPDLAITKDDGGITTSPGSTVSYTLSYANNGNQDATGVVLTETVPVGTSFNAGASTAGWSCVPDASAGSTCTLTIGSLAVAASSMATFAVDVDDPVPAGYVEVDCTVSIADDGTNGSDPTPADNMASDPTPVTAAPDLAITKDDGGITTSPGSTVSYTLSYANNGNQDATGVVLTETVPVGTSFNAGASTAGWSCVPDASAGSTCTLTIGSLAVAANGMAVFAVTIDNPVPSGFTQVDNTASIADDGTNGTDGTPVDNMASDSTPLVIMTPTVEAFKTMTMIVADNGNGLVDPGETLTYEVTVTNLGVGTALGMVYDDTPDANTTLVNGSVTTSQGMVTVGNGAGDAAIQIDIGDLTQGQMVTIIYQVDVDDPLPADVQEIVNQGLVTGINFTDVATDDPDTVTVGDPTTVPVNIGTVIDVPTLDNVGLIALALLLLIVARRRLRTDQG